MLKGLSILLVVALVTAFATADMGATLDFDVTRDVNICGAHGGTWTEQLSNAGAASQSRIGKWRQHFVLMDFDWAAMDQFRTDNPLEPDYALKIELRLTGASQSDLLADSSYQLNTCMMNAAGMDWAESDGPMSFANYNWTTDPAANFRAPKMNLDGTYTADRWMWAATVDPTDPGVNNNGFDAYRLNCLANSADVSFPTGFVPGDDVWTVFDEAMLDEQLNNAQAKGIYTFDVDNNGTNGAIYMKEQNVTQWPLMRMSFVSTIPPTPGDCDEDGDVDGTDLATLGLNWAPSGMSKVWAEGDFDADGDVDGTDLAALGVNWNPSGAVPEPTTMGLLAIGAVAFIRRRK